MESYITIKMLGTNKIYNDISNNILKIISLPIEKDVYFVETMDKLTLDKLCEYADYYCSLDDKKKKLLKKSISDFPNLNNIEAKWIKTFLKNMEIDDKIKLMNISHSYGIAILTDIICADIAFMLKDKSVEEISNLTLNKIKNN